MADKMQSAAANPTAAAEAAKAIADSYDPPEFKASEAGAVDLPGGLRLVDIKSETGFDDIRTAWVRELNGADEERISKVRTSAKVSATEILDVILSCGVERLGGIDNPDEATLRQLILGDRDQLLLEISRVTYGDQLDYGEVKCPQCGEDFHAWFDKSEDIPTVRLDSIKDEFFTVPLRIGVARVTLPTGEDQAQFEKLTTPAEITSAVLRRCVKEITKTDGTVVNVSGDPEAVRTGLGIVDRKKIVDAIADKQPGPRYNKVVIPHEECGGSARVSVNLFDLFQGI